MQIRRIPFFFFMYFPFLRELLCYSANYLYTLFIKYALNSKIQSHATYLHLSLNFFCIYTCIYMQHLRKKIIGPIFCPSFIPRFRIIIRYNVYEERKQYPQKSEVALKRDYYASYIYINIYGHTLYIGIIVHAVLLKKK